MYRYGFFTMTSPQLFFFGPFYLFTTLLLTHTPCHILVSIKRFAVCIAPLAAGNAAATVRDVGRKLVN